MNTKQLKLFLLIADLKSFSKAAELEALTQPAVTQQILRLEKELDSTLLRRKHKRIDLTKRGKLFYRFARNMLSMVENLEKEMKVIDKGDESYIRIGSSHIPTSSLLYSKIAEFKKEYPNAYIIYELSDTENICYMVENGIIDLGFVGAVVNGELNYTSFSGDELKLIAHRDFDVPSEISLQDLKTIPLIINQRESGVRRFLESKLEEYNILFSDLNIISEIGLPEALIQIVQSGVGCAFVPSIMLEKRMEDGDLRVINIRDFSPYRSYYAVTKKGVVLSKLAQQFLNSFVASSK
jgi:DNA-binding transcriptional LysR family regulator